MAVNHAYLGLSTAKVLLGLLGPALLFLALQLGGGEKAWNYLE
jgi:hypothetical protein